MVTYSLFYTVMSKLFIAVVFFLSGWIAPLLISISIEFMRWLAMRKLKKAQTSPAQS